MTKEIDISTVLIEGDTATIMGVKYKRVEPPKPTTLYDALQCPLHINGYHFNEDQKDWICEVVEEWLPKEQSAAGSQNVDVEFLVDGFNDCLKEIKGKLR